VGGTSSAIYCIYLNALASGLLKENDDWVYSARYALDSLKMYTQARLGDRTLMDTLCPFIDTLNDKGSNITEALQAAQEGCERTFTMSAKLGRASYLSHEQVIQSGIPDAGAYGLLKLMNGLFSHK
jgi:dihydroxyacetone kinase